MSTLKMYPKNASNETKQIIYQQTSTKNILRIYFLDTNCLSICWVDNDIPESGVVSSKESVASFIQKNFSIKDRKRKHIMVLGYQFVAVEFLTIQKDGQEHPLVTIHHRSERDIKMLCPVVCVLPKGRMVNIEGKDKLKYPCDVGVLEKLPEFIYDPLTLKEYNSYFEGTDINNFKLSSFAKIPDGNYPEIFEWL